MQILCKFPSGTLVEFAVNNTSSFIPGMIYIMNTSEFFILHNNPVLAPWQIKVGLVPKDLCGYKYYIGWFGSLITTVQKVYQLPINEYFPWHLRRKPLEEKDHEDN